MAWKKKQQEHMDLSIEVTEIKFKEYYDEWNVEDVKDDRYVFCRMYEQRVKAYEDMKKVNNLTIQVALQKYLEKEYETMRGIVGYFTGQSTRGGTFHRNPPSKIASRGNHLLVDDNDKYEEKFVVKGDN